jgi:hypothetical protein
VETSNPPKLILTSPTSGGRSVGIVRWQTQAMEFSFSSIAAYVQKDILINTRSFVFSDVT